MKRFDMHIHARNTEVNPGKLLANMEKAGIYGGCIFSNRPIKGDPDRGTSFDERLREVLAWTCEHKDRLFPVLWIHPYEDNIYENIHRAVESGVVAFKMICVDYYVYETKCMDVLAEIAKLGKPVIFHSGICWGDKPESKYNKPLNWEELIGIKGLKFSMGHCSWPWHDECIALYGKFLNGLTLNPSCAEMFFDLTPGTPMIYREELLRKLMTVGYDVPDNIMFGTDGAAHNYDLNWTKEWMKLDDQIYDSLGVTEDIKEKIYGDNLMRFLGLKEKDFTHISPVCDRFQTWYPGLVRDEYKK